MFVLKMTGKATNGYSWTFQEMYTMAQGTDGLTCKCLDCGTPTNFKTLTFKGNAMATVVARYPQKPNQL